MARNKDLSTTVPSASGPAKIDRRTKDLVKRLAEGDVAVINHRDLDVVAAETLVRANPVAVVNADAVPGSEPWKKFMVLVNRAMPAVEEKLTAAKKTTLLTYSGLLARYDQMPLLERFGVPATCRASFAMYNTREEIDVLVQALIKARDMFA